MEEAGGVGDPLIGDSNLEVHTVSTTIEWPLRADNVSVCIWLNGQWNWMQLRKNEHAHSVVLQLQPDTYWFMYNVDGVDRHNPYLSWQCNEAGVELNFICVKGPDNQNKLHEACPITAEYIDDGAPDLHCENTTTAEVQTSSCRGYGVSLPQISSPDREAELETDAPTMDSGLPAWILLDPVSYIDDDGDLHCPNATTAEAQTISWREDGVKVSFFAANPPCPSHFSIHIPSLTKKPHLLSGRPSILYSVRNLALISVTFGGYKSQTEYYLYRVVGHGRRPSLVHLKYISQQLREVIHVVSVGILPRDGDGGFVLAALALEQAKWEQYGVHVLRCERGAWTTKVLLLERHQIGNMRLYNIEKVIALADGELGFVDLWNGILALDVLQENLIPRYIPLPKLLPGNHSDDQLGLSAKRFRDVIISTDGCIKCIELEMCWKRIVHEKPRASDCTESQKDVWESDILYDVDLMHHQIVDIENEEVKEIFDYLGWRFISWSREPDFACWRKDCSIHAKDIINSAESQLWGSSSHALQLNELYVSFPTLSMDGNELYVVSKVHLSDLESRVIVVDLGKNSLKEFSPFPTKRPDLFEQAYIACDLFKYMNMPSDETETGWDDAYLSVSPTLEPSEESGVTKWIRPSNHYPTAVSSSATGGPATKQGEENAKGRCLREPKGA